MPPPKKFTNFLLFVGAAILSFAIIAAIKLLLLPTISQDSMPTQNILALEVAVIAVFIGAFLFGEVFEGLQRIIIELSRNSRKPNNYTHHVSPVFLLGALVTSAFIYVGAWAVVENVNAANSTTSKSHPPDIRENPRKQPLSQIHGI